MATKTKSTKLKELKKNAKEEAQKAKATDKNKKILAKAEKEKAKAKKTKKAPFNKKRYMSDLQKGAMDIYGEAKFVKKKRITPKEAYQQAAAELKPQQQVYRR